jgi:DNA polymerase-1
VRKVTTAAPSANGTAPHTLTPAQREAVAALAPAWPGQGGRNKATMALCGGLLRDGVPVPVAEALVAELTRVVNDDSSRIELVKRTHDRLQADEPTQGWPALAEMLGDRGAGPLRQFRRLLGLLCTLEDLAAHKQLPVTFLQDLGLRDLPEGGVGIPYKDAGGRTVEVKKRTRLSAGAGSWWPKGKPLMAYGEDRLDQLIQAGFLTLVEGESDSWAGWYHRLPVLGIPGANAVDKTLCAGHVSAVRRILVVQEPDQGGQTFLENVRDRLAALGWSGALLAVRLDGAKDLSELHLQDPDRFEARWAQAVAAAQPIALAVTSWPDPVPLGEVPEAPSFPVDVLPAPLARLVEEIAWAANVPPDMAAVPLITLAGGALANSRRLAITNSHFQSASLFAAVVCRPGSGKSIPLQTLGEPFNEIQFRWFQEWEAALAAWEQADEDERGPRPVCRQCLVDDITTESLKLVLLDNARGVCGITDEIMALVGGFNQYKGGRGNDRTFYLKLWNGDRILANRKSERRLKGGPLFIPDPFCSLYGTTQPDMLECLRGEYARGSAAKDDGFFDRFLFSYPAELPAVGETWREVSARSKAVWRNVVVKLLGLAMTLEEGRERPVRVGLTACGRNAWEGFTKAHAAEMNSCGFSNNLYGPWSKLRGYCGRLSLIVHFLRWAVEDVTTEAVDGESVQRAATLVDYFKGHARKVHACLGTDARLRQARKVVRWIVDHGLNSFSKRDAHHGLEGSFKTVEDLDPVLALLEKHYLIRPEPRPDRDGAGRKPSPRYEVHPAVHDLDRQNRQNRQNAGAESSGDRSEGHSVDSVERAEAQETDADPDGGHVPVPSTAPPPVHEPDRQNRQNSGAEDPGDRSDGHSVDCVDSVDEGEAPERNGNPAHNGTSPTGKGAQVQRRGSSLRACAVGGVPVVKDNGLGAAAETLGRAATEMDRRCTMGEYTLLQADRDLSTVLAALDESTRVGLDLETTALTPREGKIRLLTLATDRGLYVIDAFAVDVRPLFEALAETTLLGHNLLFDLQFLTALGFAPGRVRDSMLLSQLLDGPRKGKGFHSLVECVQRHLDIKLDKTEQKGDWSGSLTAKQLDYAAADAAVLRPLHDRLDVLIRDAGLERVADLESGALPAVAWMALSGVPFDQAAWEALATEAASEAEVLARQLDEAAPVRPGYLSNEGSWNWDSPEQVTDVLTQAGCKVEGTDDDHLAAIDHPLAALIRRYRGLSKLASTYGVGWIKGTAVDGRLYAGWRQIGCITGRMASGTPNLQNLPADPRYRNCFRAPDGRVLIKADYSQIELRLAAKIAGDAAMLGAYARNEDLHTLTAARMTGKPVVEVTPKERKLAKPVNFGLIYGLMPNSLRRKAKAEYGVDLSPEEAERYRRAFFETYPGIARWHARIRGARATETRTLAGRRALVEANDFYGKKANYAVQGSGGDGIKQAMALMWQRRGEQPDARLVLAVHDELVIECDRDQAEAAAAWLRRAMIDGMGPLLGDVPVEVEVAIGQTWGGD